MTFDSPSAADYDAQDRYTYQVNALIEHGREDLVTEVVDEARLELDRLGEAGVRPPAKDAVNG